MRLFAMALSCASQLALAQTASTPAGNAAPAAAPVPLLIAVPQIPAAFIADLTTVPMMSALAAQWRNMDVKIVEVPAIANAAPTWKTTYVLQPLAGAAAFDDSAWPVAEPKSLLDRRGGGHLSMTWFRSMLTMPAKLGEFETTGTKVALVITVDDYAEVWVNGQMPRSPGRTSPGAIQGYNVPNRVMLSEAVKPGDKFQIAILAINGPISVSPSNQVFFRQAQLEFFR
jgi:hypothetical protein